MQPTPEGLTSELWELYREWKGLTEKEGAAILDSNWPEVRRCQTAKQHLQSEIIRRTDSARAACGTALQVNEFQSGIRSRVNELIALESQNNLMLDRRLEALKQEEHGLAQSARRVRQVHQSYSSAQGPVWDRYS